MAPTRALPTPRAEGMSNIIAATIRLLEVKGPHEVTLRDVAKESGHGHRLISEWFGGKGGLYAAVVMKTFENLVSTGELFYSDIAVRPEVRAAVRVFNYMQMHHREFVEGARTTFLRDAFRARLMELRGLSEAEADLGTRRIFSLTMGLATFAQFQQLTDEEVIQMTKDEVKSSMGFDLSDNPNRT